MIIRKQPLVKLLEQADQLYEPNHEIAGRGRSYVYSERTMFKCLLVKAVKRLDDCSGLYNYLAHESNAHIRQAVGLQEVLPLMRAPKSASYTNLVQKEKLIAMVENLKLSVQLVSRIYMTVLPVSTKSAYEPIFENLRLPVWTQWITRLGGGTHRSVSDRTLSRPHPVHPY